ncbi:MAG: AAA family ATPase [Kiritimatiellia bacterium]
MIARNAELHLKHWLDKKRRKPLVLRGARQVGKSTLVRQFAAHHGLILNEINLEKHLRLDEVFKSLDIKKIVLELEGLVGRNIFGGGLLFLDEVQATPHALAALRYFYEELPDLPVIAAGSLLEFALAKHSFSMPVGRVEYHHIGPVSFSEFIACKEPDLNPWRAAAARFEEIPETAHQRLLARLREYLFVGGMPEAVLEFLESGSLSEVQEVQRSIVETYQDDFAKYAQQAELVRLQRVFGKIPRHIGRKIKYANLSRDERSREIKACVELLSRAHVCQKVIASHCSGLPLSAETAEDTYKLIFMDVGIVNYLCGGRWKDISEASGQVLVNEGPLAEQFVGQHLAYLGRDKPELHYWLREGRANNAEVDYVIAKGSRILPVEVKAGAGGSLKSLQQFVLEKKSMQAIRFDLNRPSKMMINAKARSGDTVVDVQVELMSLPLYAVESLAGLSGQSQ